MKTYICPKTEIYQLEAESMLAGSLNIKDEVGNKKPLSFKRSIWTGENWNETEDSDIDE